MTQVLSTRPDAFRTYAAIILFAIGYLGVLTMVLAPRDMIAVQLGSELPISE